MIMYLELLIPGRTHLVVSNAAVSIIPFHKQVKASFPFRDNDTDLKSWSSGSGSHS